MENKVILGDCMDYMKGLEDNAFELAIVDPPYGLAWNHTGGNSISKEEAEKANQWDSLPDQKYFDELQRVSKNCIIWGGNHFLDYLGKMTSVIVWDKKNRGMHFADGEMAWTNIKGGALRIFEYAVRNEKGTRIHPTQKPIALYKWLLKNYAHPGDKILDTHIGSGSIRIACRDMGFDLIGCELDKDYYEAQEARFQRHIAQGDLFGADEMQELIFND